MATREPTLEDRQREYRQHVAGALRALMGQGVDGKRVTNARLAEHLGMSPQSFGERMNGKVPFNIDELDKVSAFFNVSIVDLLARDEIERRVHHAIAKANRFTDQLAGDPSDLRILVGA